MQADPCIIAGNNPAVFRGFRANTFPFAGLHGNLLGSEVNLLSSGFCPSGPSLSDNVVLADRFPVYKVFFVLQNSPVHYLIQPCHHAERLFVPDLPGRLAWGGLVSPVITAGQMI